MKKIVLALLAMFTVAGLTIAAVVTVKEVNADKKEITVTDADGKDATYTWDDKTKFSRGDKEVKSEDALKMLTNEKAKGKLKLDVTVDGKKLTEGKFSEKKKKDKAKTDKSN